MEVGFVGCVGGFGGYELDEFVEVVDDAVVGLLGDGDGFVFCGIGVSCRSWFWFFCCTFALDFVVDGARVFDEFVGGIGGIECVDDAGAVFFEWVEGGLAGIGGVGKCGFGGGYAADACLCVGAKCGEVGDL